jgi:hypothetical protein
MPASQNASVFGLMSAIFSRWYPAASISSRIRFLAIERMIALSAVHFSLPGAKLRT